MRRYRDTVTVLMGLGFRLRLAKLHVICDPRTKKGDLGEFAAAAFAGGVDMLQLRAPHLGQRDVVKALEVLRRAAVLTQGLVVTDDAQAAAAFEGDVLHLGWAGGSTGAAKAALHRWAMIGRSAHSDEQLAAANADVAVDYLFVGPVWVSGGEHPAPGLDIVRHAADVLPPFAVPERSKPWFAVGGITSENLGEVIGAGARRVCVSRAITEASNPEAAARALKAPLVQAWADDPASEAYVVGAFTD